MDTHGRLDDCGKYLDDLIVVLSKEVISMGTVLILAFVVLIGPLSYFFGADSRRSTDRGWVAAER